ncbi:MAG TPA: tetratricopeptide repeat protein [Planctomycetota bacterium]|nr:tetratricopeptide repeat protein [Planctomycetota bacterium]
MRYLRSIVACAVALSACTAAAFGGDIFRRPDGTFTPAIKGSSPSQADHDASTYQVANADTEKVTYAIKVGDRLVTQSEPSTRIAEIILEPRKYPPEWKQCLQAFEGGDYKNAYAGFSEIGAAEKVNPVVRQKALLNAARAAREGGKADEAEKAYGALLKAFPNSFYSAAALQEQSQMYMDAGVEDKARKFAEALLKLPGVSDGDKLQARFLQVTVDFRNAVAKKDQAGIQKALDAYKALATETAGKKDFMAVNQLARIGQGNCLLELGTPAGASEAKGIFQEIADRAQDKPVCASAFNGLGDCLFREGNFAEARRCFLRTATIYTEGTPGDQVARALYYAGECFSKLQDSPDWKDRAKQEFSECVRRFPKSAWAEKADRGRRALPK